MQNIVSGILEGSLYALLGLGMGLIFGVMRIVPLSHGDFMVLSSFATFWLFQLFGVDPFLSLALVVPMMFVIGLATQRFVISHAIAKAEHQLTGSVLITFALALIIANSEILAWSGNFRQVITSYSSTMLSSSGITLNVVRLTAFGFAIAVAVALYLLLAKTKFGRALRASSFDRDAIGFMGISFKRMASFTFGIGTAVAALSGMLYVTIYYVYPAQGLLLTIKAFIVLVLGGMGSIFGAVAAGLTLGIVENLGAFYFGPGYKDAVGFAVLLLILIIRPKGILGKEAF